MSKVHVVIDGNTDKATTGTISLIDFGGFTPEDSIGERVTVEASDENGNPITAEGVLTEVLCVEE